MILHTIVDPSVIWGQDHQETPNTTLEMNYRGIRLEVQQEDPQTYVIHRIISSNPGDYLSPEIQPGKKIEMIYQAQG